MKRRYKIAIGTVGILGALWLAGALLLVHFVSGETVTKSKEIEITPEIAAHMQAEFGITVQQAHDVSSYGGWHGDGEAVSVYLFPSSESPVLRLALEKRWPGTVWKEVPSNPGYLMGMRTLLRSELVPQDGTILWDGWPEVPGGSDRLQVIVAKDQGLLYFISHRF